MNSENCERIDFNLLRSLIQPNEEGCYTATVAGSTCRIKPVTVEAPDRIGTWSVEVGAKRIVTEADDFDHALRQAIAYAERIADGICGPRV